MVHICNYCIIRFTDASIRDINDNIVHSVSVSDPSFRRLIFFSSSMRLICRSRLEAKLELFPDRKEFTPRFRAIFFSGLTLSDM